MCGVRRRARMAIQLPESDWRLFKPLSRIALDRFCARVLADIAAVSADASKTNHERYGAIYALIRDRDRELAQTFDGMSRSRALHQLALMARHGLVTAEELAPFSQSTRAYLAEWST